MEARGAVSPLRPGSGSRVPAWLLGLLPLALIAVAIAAFALLGAPGLGERSGPPVEDLAVERTTLRPGEIELTVRNDGPDPVRIAQVSVNDAYVDFEASEGEVGRLGSATITIPYGWIEGEAYEIFLLTSTGGTIDHTIDVAAETPRADAGFFGLMALLGIYVGIIPVALGMLWLPFVRRIDRRWVQFLLALTVGLLAFLAVDAVQEGVDAAQAGPQAFGGAALVFVGALIAYLVLAGIDAYLSERRSRAKAAAAAGPAGANLALLIAVGIGLHNLGEGLAIGSSYALGALALGAFLVVGFAIHNTTEGLAIVAPLSSEPAPVRRLAALGLVAGAPAVLGAAIGATAFHASLAAFLLGVGAGAIAQVIQQIVPSIRDAAGRALHPLSVAGILAGLALMFVTGLLVSV
jgi:zinc transporter, ZIP family